MIETVCPDFRDAGRKIVGPLSSYPPNLSSFYPCEFRRYLTHSAKSVTSRESTRWPLAQLTSIGFVFCALHIPVRIIVTHRQRSCHVRVSIGASVSLACLPTNCRALSHSCLALNRALLQSQLRRRRRRCRCNGKGGGSTAANVKCGVGGATRRRRRRPRPR